MNKTLWLFFIFLLVHSNLLAGEGSAPNKTLRSPKGKSQPVRSYPSLPSWAAAMKVFAKGRTVEAKKEMPKHEPQTPEKNSKKPEIPGDDQVSLAKTAAAGGDWKTAAGYYQKAVDANPKSYDNKFQLARALSFSGQREEAIRVYSELLAESPGNSDVLLGRGRVFAWMKKVPESEADLLAATRRSPTYQDVWSALGDLYRWNDRPKEAAAAYGKCIELKPSDPKPFLDRGKAFRSANDFPAARADFETARKLGWDNKEIDQNLNSLMPRLSNPDATIPEGFRWSAGISYSKSKFTPDRDDWQEIQASVRRRFNFGSLAIESLNVSRFTKWDDAYALDAYVDLWKRAYGNFRYQRSPDAILYPKTAMRGEIYQSFGKGWEFSVSRDQLNFPNSTTNMTGLGLGKYIGNWYIRWRSLLTPGDDWVNVSNSLLARNYFSGTADDYWGISVSSNHGNKYGYGNKVVATDGSSVGAVFQKYFSASSGYKISASVGKERDGFTERTFTIGLTKRW